MATLVLGSTKGRYHVQEQVAEAPAYRLYLCTEEKTGEERLMQIAATLADNGGLDRGALCLQQLKQASDEHETAYAQARADPTDILNYHLCFPALVDSFICHSQGARRINILAFSNVEKINSMVPLVGITSKDRRRVDLRTSVWIMGKLLKLLAFAHGLNLSVRHVTGGNILIEPTKHYVVLFDWSQARFYPEIVPREVRAQEIAAAAQAVITALGSDSETGQIPNDGEVGFTQYTEYLQYLASAQQAHAQTAHRRFYDLVDALWERGYYHFVSYPL